MAKKRDSSGLKAGPPPREASLVYQPHAAASPQRHAPSLGLIGLTVLDYVAGFALMLFCLIAVALSVNPSYNLIYKGSGLVSGALVILFAHQAGTLRWCLRSGFLILYGVFNFLSVAWILLNPVASSGFSTIIILFALTTVVFIYVATTRRMWPIFYGFLGGLLFIFFSGGAAFTVTAAESDGQRFFYSTGEGEALNPNIYGFLLICILLLSLRILFVDEKPSTRWLMRLRSFHCVCAIFAAVISIQQMISVTGSRKILVLLLVSAAGTGGIYLARRLSLARLMWGVTISMMFLFVAYTLLRESAFFVRFLTITEIVDGRGIEDDSSAIRVAMASKGIEMWLESPLWGHGTGYFQHHSGFYAYAHSNPIEILVSMGIMGAFLFYAAMLAAAKDALATFISTRVANKAEAAWVLLLFFCLALFQMAQVVAFGHLLYFSVIIGVAAAYSYGMRRGNNLKRLGSLRALATAASYRGE